MQRLTEWVTSRRYLMLLLEKTVSNPVIETLLTWIIRINAWVFILISTIIRVIFRVNIEDITVFFMKLPLIRETTVKVMLMLKPIMSGTEPEGLYVFREIMRIRGVKEIILPVVMSTGVMIETLTAPDVISKLGKKKAED